MKAYIRIVNQQLYDNKVNDVDVTGLTGFTGTLSIDTVESGKLDFTGRHGSRDYQDDYGFVLRLKN